MAVPENATQSNWWDGFTDGASELASDLFGGAASYFNSQTAQAEAQKAANENATLSEQARIAQSNAALQAQQAQSKQQILMLGGVALLIILVLLLKK